MRFYRTVRCVSSVNGKRRDVPVEFGFFTDFNDGPTTINKHARLTCCERADLACRAEGYYMNRYIAGDQRAAKILAEMKGQIPAMIKKYFAL